SGRVGGADRRGHSLVPFTRRGRGRAVRSKREVEGRSVPRRREQGGKFAGGGTGRGLGWGRTKQTRGPRLKMERRTPDCLEGGLSASVLARHLAAFVVLVR